MSSTTSSASTTDASPTTTDTDTYNFSIRETTIRNWAIGIGITLGVLLICALITIQVMRSKMKRLKKERDVYAMKLNGLLVDHSNKYESIPPSAIESGHIIPRHELDNTREVFESDATPAVSSR